MPKTTSGKWSMWLIPIMVVLFFLGTSLTSTLYESVPAGGTIPADIVKRPALAISMLMGFGTGIGAFVLGLVSIVKQKERAFLVFIATLIGAGVVLFLVLEFAFPH